MIQNYDKGNLKNSSGKIYVLEGLSKSIYVERSISFYPNIGFEAFINLYYLGVMQVFVPLFALLYLKDNMRLI